MMLLEPLKDILAEVYACVSYVLGHDATVTYEMYVMASVCSAGAWRSLHADPITSMTEVGVQGLHDEF